MTDGHERDDSKKGKKTRGRTMKAGIHALTEKDQKAIIMNANFQPIGPDEQTVIDFVEFLGTLSRTSSLCPLTVDKWTDMNKVYKDAKEKMWDYVKVEYASYLHTLYIVFYNNNMLIFNLHSLFRKDGLFLMELKNGYYKQLVFFGEILRIG
ncbi:hypothetical protein Dimus_039330 [Dionaea muscipula]